MLVLVSFALVLLAAGLLLVGLAVDSGLTLIYASIGCSLAAGILLILATRARRGAPGPPPMAGAPAPPMAGAPVPPTMAGAEPDDEVPRHPVDDRADASFGAPADPAGDESAAGPPPAAPTQVLAGAEDYLFPIGNYEQRPVSEILALLDHLYEDELDMVEARERRGPGRPAVLSRVAELRRRFEPAPPPGPDLLWPGDDQAVTDAARPPGAAGASSSPAGLPIPGYTTLRGPDVEAALAPLSLAELEQVRAFEETAGRRQAVIEAIDRRRAALVDTAGGAPTGERAEPERP